MDRYSPIADIVWTAEGEAWKFDQAAYDAYVNPVSDEAEEAGDEAETEAEPSAEETAAEPEEAPAP